MKSVGNTGSTVWVETDSLSGWKVEMATINESAVNIINSIVNELSSLSDSWKGSAAEGFETTMENALNTIVGCHNEMKDLEVFLSTVAETMGNQ